jgi:hypothetical protein
MGAGPHDEAVASELAQAAVALRPIEERPLSAADARAYLDGFNREAARRTLPYRAVAVLDR